MPAYAYWILGAGTILWCAPFPLARRNGGSLLQLDKRARWGLALEFVAYTLLWQGSFWLRSPPSWCVAASILFFVLAAALSWTGALALGKQLRVDAAIGRDHELVKTGPYRIVRHPIYTSMLCLVVGTGLLLAPLWMLTIALALFVAGTQIRVTVEDGLLASRFGAPFVDYRRTVPAYIPFVKY